MSGYQPGDTSGGFVLTDRGWVPIPPTGGLPAGVKAGIVFASVLGVLLLVGLAVRVGAPVAAPAAQAAQVVSATPTPTPMPMPTPEPERALAPIPAPTVTVTKTAPAPAPAPAPKATRAPARGQVDEGMLVLMGQAWETRTSAQQGIICAYWEYTPAEAWQSWHEDDTTGVNRATFDAFFAGAC